MFKTDIVNHFNSFHDVRYHCFYVKPIPVISTLSLCSYRKCNELTNCKPFPSFFNSIFFFVEFTLLPKELSTLILLYRKILSFCRKFRIPNLKI